MKKQPKLTPWFPDDAKPFHIGVYETMAIQDWYDGTPDFQYWDGCVWGPVSTDPEFAYTRNHFEGNFQDVPWRGLAQKPKAVKP